MPKLTKRRVDALEPRAQIYDVYDTEIAGFHVRVHPTGRKSFYLYYRRRDGRKRRLMIGTEEDMMFSELRETAADWKTEARRGGDPVVSVKKPNSVTLEELRDEYMAKHAKVENKPGTVETDRLNWKNHILPRWRSHRVADISQDDIRSLKAAMQDRPGAFNRTLALISSALNYAEMRGWRPQHSNPCRYVKPYPSHRRNRLLTPDEWGQFADAMAIYESYGAVQRRFVAGVRLLLITGARRGEIFSAKWTYWDGGNLLRLPDSKTGPKSILLPAPAVDIINGIERVENNPYMIAGKKTGRPMAWPRAAWVTMCKQGKLQDFRMHDLRHQFATAAINIDIPLPKLQSLLGHSNVKTTQGYVHLLQLGLTSTQLQVDAVAEHVAGLLENKTMH